MSDQKGKIELKEELAKNCKAYIDSLVKGNYFGELHLKFDNGFITVGDIKDKIKFDDVNFLKYLQGN